MKTLTEFIRESINDKAPNCPVEIKHKVEEVIGGLFPTEETIWQYYSGLYMFLLDASKFLQSKPNRKQLEDLFNILRVQQETCPLTLIENDNEELEVIKYSQIKNLVNWDSIWEIFSTPGFSSPKGSGWFGYQFVVDDINELKKLEKYENDSYAL